MSNTSNASKNVRRFLLLFALGIAYGFMYVMPYMKSSFYDQMIAAMGCTNAQLGSLMTAYCICCTVSYLPGGWIGDKFNPKPVLLISIFGQAALSFLFMFTYKSYAMAVIIWLLMGLTGGFAFWPAIMKGIRLTGTDEEQGRMYGIFEALNGFASLLLSFIMIGVIAVFAGSDLITGFKSALAFMGGLSIVSGILVAILMPKDAAYGVSEEEKQKKRLMFSLHNDKHRDEIYDVFERIQRNSKKIQARKLFDYNIVLIGFMGAGKSTISDYLSTMFAMEVVEMDQLIAEREGMSISDIFETYGEEYFRNMETNLLIEMQEKKNVIISCGGGVAMRERNVAEMKKNGRVVLLTAHPQTILDRVKDSDDRPLLNGHKNVEYIEQLMEARREKYEAAADIVVDTDNKTVLQICEDLIQKLLEMDENHV